MADTDVHPHLRFSCLSLWERCPRGARAERALFPLSHAGRVTALPEGEPRPHPARVVEDADPYDAPPKALPEG